MTRRKDAPPSQVKGNIMKNNTFGQFALAKASADLMKKVLNK